MKITKMRSGDFTKYFYDEVLKYLHYKNNEEEFWKEFNAKGDMIHFKDNHGYETFIKYDENGHEIYFKNSDGFERWTMYGVKENKTYVQEVHGKSNTGEEWWSGYDENGTRIYYKDNQSKNNSENTDPVEIKEEDVKPFKFSK